MTAYNRAPSGLLRVWVPRRSRLLHTYPGKLDTTVAGGVAATETPWGHIIREAEEEASLSADLVRRHAKSVGCLSYMGLSTEGRVLADVLYVYDLELSLNVVPRPNDDEVEAFHSMSLEQVKQALLRQEFKTNSAVVMIDFFIRHGIVTAAEEDDFVEISTRMHRRLPFRSAPGG